MTDSLAALRELLSFNDYVDTAAGIGGVQLIPDNGARILRLEVAAGAMATCRPSMATTRFTKPRWHSCLNGGHVSKLVATREDPFPNLFTEELVLSSQAFIVFPGLEEDSVCVLRQMIDTLQTMSVGEPDTPLARESRALWTSVLILSDAVAGRALLVRGVRAQPQTNSLISIPDATRFAQLKAAVTFSRDELTQLLTPSGGSVDALLPLTIDSSSPAQWDGEIRVNPAASRPIIRHGDRFVVAAPHSLLWALRTDLLRLVLLYRRVDEFVDAFRQTGIRVVDRALRLMGLPALQPPTFVDGNTGLSESFYILDTDKVLHLVLVTDSLADYSPDDSSGHWKTEHLARAVDERLAWIDSNLPTKADWVEHMLHLVVFQGVGRSMTFGFNHEGRRCHLLHAQVAELRQIALLERGDPLALWHFARWSSIIRGRAEVMAFSTVDEYSLYRSSHHSFYLSDDAQPDFVSVLPDLGELLRAEVHTQRDFHGAFVPWENRFRVVTRLHRDTTYPVYVIWQDSSHRIARRLEAYDTPVWVTAPAEISNSNYRQLQVILADMLCYWLWQFASTLGPEIDGRKTAPEALIVELEVEPSDAWFTTQASRAAGETSGEAVVECVPLDDRRLSIKFRAAVAALLSKPDNEGERVVLAVFLPALLSLLRSHAVSAHTVDVPRAIDRIAPLGLKKNVTFLPEISNPRLIEGTLPPYRPTQDAAKQLVLEYLGSHLSRQGWWRPGMRIADDRRTAILNDVIAYLFERLQQVVSSLTTTGTLEWLVAYHERFVYEDAIRRFQMPTRLAAFGTMASHVQDTLKERPRLATSSMACRFLIEYVAAQPSQGTRPMSRGTFDELMALAGEIAHWGVDSDAIHFKIEQISLTMLKSRRLGIDRGNRSAVEEQYFRAFYSGELERSAKLHGRYWRGPGQVKPTRSALVEAADKAAATEFGATLTDLQTFLLGVMELGAELAEEAKVMERSELERRIHENSGTDPAIVARCLETFTARPRTNFLSPAPPARKEDVYPWRFNRELSYLRKPLLLRISQGREEVVWGNRHLAVARDYLMDLCIGGRLKARSTEMKVFIGRLQSDEAEAFNDRVAELYERDRHLIVRRRVKKIGGLRIQRRPGEDLGDIDVLVADPRARRIIAVETKDLAVARTPAELANELQVTFQVGGTHSSAIERHVERIEWLRTHMDTVLTWLKVDSTGKWKVEGLMVTDTELMSPYLYRTPIPVESITTLENRLGP